MHTLKVSAVLVILLAIILATGLHANSYLSKTAEKMEAHISRIESTAKSGNWSKAEEQLSIAKIEWSDTARVWSMLIDHIEIDNIESTLSRMGEYIKTQDTSMALAEIATLKQYIKHIPEKEAFNLKNIL